MLDDYGRGSLYGLEKFWAFLKYRKSRAPLEMDPALDTLLARFTCLDDFARQVRHCAAIN